MASVIKFSNNTSLRISVEREPTFSNGVLITTPTISFEHRTGNKLECFRMGLGEFLREQGMESIIENKLF